MTKPHATCAALMGDNTRCEKVKQCARAVAWFDDRHAAFNLCLPHGSDAFNHFLPSSPELAPAPAGLLKPQLDLFA